MIVQEASPPPVEPNAPVMKLADTQGVAVGATLVGVAPKEPLVHVFVDVLNAPFGIWLAQLDTLEPIVWTITVPTVTTTAKIIKAIADVDNMLNCPFLFSLKRALKIFIFILFFSPVV